MKKLLSCFICFFLLSAISFSQQAITDDAYITVLLTDLDSVNRQNIARGLDPIDESIPRQIKDRIEANIKKHTKFKITDPISYLADYSIISYVDCINSSYILSLSMISFSTGEILFNVQSTNRKDLSDIFLSSSSAVDEVTALFCEQLKITSSSREKQHQKNETKKISNFPFSLSVEPLFGMKYGQIDEYVFLKASKQSSDKLSELNWEIKPELQYGIKIRGGWLGFFEESHFIAGIPMKSGQMLDSDWQNIQYATSSGGNEVKTNYSKSDNKLDYDISFGFKGGYEFRIFDIFRIRPAIAFEYQNIKFTGKNGSAWYGSSKSDGGYYPYDDTAHQETHDFSGQRVITYQRISDYLWLGSDFSLDLPINLSVTAGFFFAPYVYAISYDSHLLTKKDYADKTIDSFAAFKWNFGLEYKIYGRHSLALTASYFYMPVIRGSTYEKKSTQSSYTLSSVADSGAASSWFDLTLSYKFQIF